MAAEYRQSCRERSSHQFAFVGHSGNRIAGKAGCYSVRVGVRHRNSLAVMPNFILASVKYVLKTICMIEHIPDRGLDSRVR